MDFLDPKKRKRYHVRLMIGYVLLTIAISLGTVILVYAIYGYGINTKTGQIIQNGLLITDSKPSGAKVYINGVEQSATTSTKFVLPSGSYRLSISKLGYRDWSKNFSLDEHSVKRYTYPLLLPSKPVETVAKSYASMPTFVAQTPDLKTIVVQSNGSSFTNFSLDQFDTNDQTKKLDTVAYPAELFSFSDGQLELVQWASDGDHLLVKHFNQSSSEFILLSRGKPLESVNINKLFNVAPTNVSLYDNKPDQVYVFDAVSHTLRLGSISQRTLAKPLISQVQDYKVFSGGLVLYATVPDPKGLVSINALDNGQTYKLSTINEPKDYVLDAANFQGQWYYLLNAPVGDTVNLYQDPLSQLKDPAVGKIVPLANFSLDSFNQFSFFDSGRNLILGNGKDYIAYDIENKIKNKFSFNSKVALPITWLDAYHLAALSGDRLIILDYDGDNQQDMGVSSLAGAMLSRDSKHLFTIRQSALGFDLINIDLRAGSDLPKQ